MTRGQLYFFVQPNNSRRQRDVTRIPLLNNNNNNNNNNNSSINNYLHKYDVINIEQLNYT